jgi:hypothetical protein
MGCPDERVNVQTRIRGRKGLCEKSIISPEAKFTRGQAASLVILRTCKVCNESYQQHPRELPEPPTYNTFVVAHPPNS